MPRCGHTHRIGTRKIGTRRTRVIHRMFALRSGAASAAKRIDLVGALPASCQGMGAVMADQHHRRATLNTTVLLATGIALEATIAYRAATQSITYDEAATYLKFLQGSLTDPFRQFDASNHVLFTALARGSIGAFGVSQFSLRLPSVIGAGAFFVALALVCRRVFGFGIMPILAAATVALDPFVLDFMSAARGYGL